MSINNFKKEKNNFSSHRLAEDFYRLTHRVLFYINKNISKTLFLKEILKTLAKFSGCDAVEVHFKEGDKYSLRCFKKSNYRFDIKPCCYSNKQNDAKINKMCQKIVKGKCDIFSKVKSGATKNGSFWTGNFSNDLKIKSSFKCFCIDGDYRSLAVIPIKTGKYNLGVLQLKSKKWDYFIKNEIELYEDVAQALCIVFLNQQIQADLGERVKELTCLYGIAKAVDKPDSSLDEILKEIIDFIPPAFLYPDSASCRIILDGGKYSAGRFKDADKKLSADITVRERKRGAVEVVYNITKPDLDMGPFLKEEKKLLETIAHQIALIIERRQIEDDKSKLSDQLRHADRLATIGQLAAGVAHELNEPLADILGFAQLTEKGPRLPKQAKEDIKKIINTSLHAREIIKKLMLFARQMPPQKNSVNLNKLVKEGLYFINSRCAKAGIELVKLLSPDIPDIIADSSQMYQVLVNLAVNAVQAMPKGGKLIIKTCSNDGHVSLIVEDTGIGMSKEVLNQIFMPFFTTKDVDQGTGLGLAVVHSIVDVHNGGIKVNSSPGQGSRFEVRLPVGSDNIVKEREQIG